MKPDQLHDDRARDTVNHPARSTDPQSAGLAQVGDDWHIFDGREFPLKFA